MLRSCFLSSFIEFRSAVSEEKSKMSQPIRGQGGHLVFRIGPKNTNLVEGVGILLSVKFRWIPFSGFRGEVENVKVYAGRTTDDGRTDDGHCAMTIAHLSLWLRWAKKLWRSKIKILLHMCCDTLKMKGDFRKVIFMDDTSVEMSSNFSGYISTIRHLTCRCFQTENRSQNTQSWSRPYPERVVKGD